MPTTELTPADWDIATGEGGYTIGIPARAPNPDRAVPNNALILDLSTENILIGQLLMRVKAARMADLPHATYKVQGWADFQVDVGTSQALFLIGSRMDVGGFDGDTEWKGILLVGGFLGMGGPPTFSFLLIDASTLFGQPRLLADPVTPAAPTGPFRLGMRLSMRDGDTGPIVSAAYNIDGAEWVDIMVDFEDAGSAALLNSINGVVIMAGDDQLPAGETLVLDDFEIEEINVTPVPPPRIDSVDPQLGNTNGGSSVVLHGANFISVQSVQFFDPLFAIEAQWVVDSPTEISVIAPPNYSGFVDIRVVTATGEAVFEDFEYQDLGPADFPYEDFEDASWDLPDPDSLFPLSVPYADAAQVRRVTEAAAYPIVPFPDARPGTLDSTCGLVAIERVGRLTLALSVSAGATVLQANEDVNNILLGSAVQFDYEGPPGSGEMVSIQSVNLATKEITLESPIEGNYAMMEPFLVTHRTGVSTGLPFQFTEGVSAPGQTLIVGTTANFPMPKKRPSAFNVAGTGIAGVDDGFGNVTGMGIVSGTIDYDTGDYSLTLASPLVDDLQLTYRAYIAFYGQGSFYSPEADEGRMEIWFKVDEITGVFAEDPSISGGFEILARFFAEHGIQGGTPIESTVALAAFVRASASAVTGFDPEDLRLELYQLVSQSFESDIVPLVSMTLPGVFATTGVGQFIGLRLTVEEASLTTLRYVGEYNLGEGWVEAFDQTLATNATHFIGQSSRWGWRVNASKSVFAGDATHDDPDAEVSVGHRVVVRVDDWRLEKF